MSFASGELPQPITPITFMEGDAVLFLKQENGRLNALLREQEERHEKEVRRLEGIIDSCVDEYGEDEVLGAFRRCGDHPCGAYYYCDPV